MSDFDARLRDLMRGLDEEDAARHEPPSTIWAAIEAGVAEDRPRHAATGAAISTQQHAATVGDAPVIDIESRRRKTQWLLGAAAAVVAIVGAAAFVAQRSNAPEVLASIDITSEGLDGAPGGLDALAVVELVDGHRQLKVGTADLTVAGDEFLELWLINGDVTDMVSLGTVSSLDEQHTYAIPDDVDLDTFSIVDVSIEPTDGDPTHSGHSVLRGRLDA